MLECGYFRVRWTSSANDQHSSLYLLTLSLLRTQKHIQGARLPGLNPSFATNRLCEFALLTALSVFKGHLVSQDTKQFAPASHELYAYLLSTPRSPDKINNARKYLPSLYLILHLMG